MTRLVLILTAALAATLSLSASVRALCVGDCDGNGSIDVSELITSVNIALGQAPLSACPLSDADGDGSLGIDELIAAVSNALNGCPASPASIAGATVATAEALGNVTSALIESIAAINANTTSATGDNCPLGGTSVRSCESVRQGVARLLLTLTQCGYPTASGSLTLDGTIALTAPGRCPSSFLPVNIAVDFQVTQIERDNSGTLQHTSTYALGGTITSLTIGASPCMVKGGNGQLNGTLASRSADGALAELDLDPSNITLLFGDFSHVCEPGLATLSVDGSGTVQDQHGTPSVDFPVQFEQVTLTDQRVAGADNLSLSGTLKGACFDTIAVDTSSPLQVLPGAVCPTGGELSLKPTGGAITTTYASGGSVQVADGSPQGPQMFASCLAEPLRTCGP